MKFLIDKSPADVNRKIEGDPDYVLGQLLTPLTGYTWFGGTYAIDNGAFSGFKGAEFARLLTRQEQHVGLCRFVCVPDIVCDARRTLEVFEQKNRWLTPKWPVALVAQNGLENLTIPWMEIDAIFIGGDDRWKDGAHAANIVRAAKILGKWVHIGRVNSPNRFNHFRKLGADSCDGTGVSMYDHMLKKIVKGDTQDELQLETA